MSSVAKKEIPERGKFISLRWTDDFVRDLDQYCELAGSRLGVRVTRSNAIRMAVREAVKNENKLLVSCSC